MAGTEHRSGPHCNRRTGLLPVRYTRHRSIPCWLLKAEKITNSPFREVSKSNILKESFVRGFVLPVSGSTLHKRLRFASTTRYATRGERTRNFHDLDFLRTRPSFVSGPAPSPSL